jgi:hypothetical protein
MFSWYLNAAISIHSTLALDRSALNIPRHLGQAYTYLALVPYARSTLYIRADTMRSPKHVFSFLCLYGIIFYITPMTYFCVAVSYR